MRTKQIIKYIATIAMVYLITKLPNVITPFMVNKIVEKAMDNKLDSIKSILPIYENQNKRLDSINKFTSKNIQFNYTLLKLRPGLFSDENVMLGLNPAVVNGEYVRCQFIDDLKIMHASYMANFSPDLKPFCDNDVTFCFVYYDEQGKLVANFTITPNEYLAARKYQPY